MQTAKYYNELTKEALKNKECEFITAFFRSLANFVFDASTEGKFSTSVERPNSFRDEIKADLESKGYKVLEVSLPVSSKRGRYTKYSWTISWN